MGFNVKISGADNALRNIDQLLKNAEDKVSGELDAFGLKTVNDAKRLCPVDEGFLRNSITYARSIKKGELTVEIIVAADYAAYIEFGTRGYAEKYVASLPQDWQEFAAKFKGATAGSFEEMVMRIFEWIRRKGIKPEPKVTREQEDTFRRGKLVRSKKPKRITKEESQQQMAYAMAVYIIRNGIKPHPFLVPAVEKNKPILIDRLKIAIK